jgi:hypothetical protein
MVSPIGRPFSMRGPVTVRDGTGDCPDLKDANVNVASASNSRVSRNQTFRLDGRPTGLLARA